MRAICGVICASVVVGALLAPRTALSDQTSLHPLIEGSIDTLEAPFAVALCEGETPFACSSRCGGTLIAPNVVLTARHCAELKPLDALDCRTYQFDGQTMAPTRIWVTTAAQVLSSSRFIQGVTWSLPLARSCGHDLALLTLTAPFDSADAVPVAPAIDEAAVVQAGGQDLTLYGFGVTGPDKSDGGRRRKLLTRLLCNGGKDGCSTVAGGRDLLPSELAVNATVCPGDSGGGVYAPGGDLLGVLARTIGPTSPCAYGVYTKTNAHALLLARTVRSSTSDSTKLPLWVVRAEHQGNAGALPARARGATCDAPADCASGMCESKDSGLVFSCVDACDSSCGAGGRCADTGAGSFCFAESSAGDSQAGGCVVAPAPAPASSVAIGGVTTLIILGAARSRRRRRALP